MVTNVLLTGASGFVGSNLLRYLLRKTEWSFVCPCSWKHKGIPERITRILTLNEGYKDRIQVITHDLEAPFTATTIATMPRCSIFLNLAADSHVDRSITDPVPFVQNNINSVLNVLELARLMKPDIFLQFSTDEVYGVAPEGINYAEWSAIVPSNPYSASKASQEAIAISYWRTYNIPLIITQTMNVFGHGQDTEKFVPKIVQSVLLGQTLTIHGRRLESGAVESGSRFYIHADNVSDAILFILNNVKPVLHNNGENNLPQRLNIVGEREVDNWHLAHLVAEIFGMPVKYTLVDFHSARAGHDRRYALDGAKLASLGWKPPTNFYDSLVRTVRWYADNQAFLVGVSPSTPTAPAKVSPCCFSSTSRFEEEELPNERGYNFID